MSHFRVCRRLSILVLVGSWTLAGPADAKECSDYDGNGDACRGEPNECKTDNGETGNCEMQGAACVCDTGCSTGTVGRAVCPLHSGSWPSLPMVVGAVLLSVRLGAIRRYHR